MNNNLKAFRAEGEMTLEALADAIGSSKSYIWELERGKSKPSLDIAYRIAKVLCASVYEIWPDETEIIEKIIRIRRVVVKKAAPKLVYATQSG